MVKKIILFFSIMLMFYSNSLTCDAAETWTKQHENNVNTFEKELSGILEKDNKDESDSKHKIVSFDISQAVERYDIVNSPLMIGLYNKNKNENDFLLDYFLVDESHKVLLNQWYIPAETESGKKCDIC
nr:hypothetical protein [Lachnospiraceae bacterium]